MATLKHPVNGYKVTNPWGARNAAYDDIGYHGHNGYDYPCPTGTPVYAAADGVIVHSGWGAGHGWMGETSGNCVLIRHDDLDCHTDYCHLSQSFHWPGDRVKQGQLIGYTGATGYVFGAHLHFSKLPLHPNFGNGYGGRINPNIRATVSPAGKIEKDGFLMALSDKQQQELYKRVMANPLGDNHYDSYVLDSGKPMRISHATGLRWLEKMLRQIRNVVVLIARKNGIPEKDISKALDVEDLPK